MAQEVEHILGKDEVTGSNPVSSSRKNHPIEMHPKSWTGKEKPVKLKRGVF